MANRKTAEVDRALAPAEPGPDTREYVPGVRPTKAEYSGDPAISQQEVLLRQRNPGAFEGPDGVLTANNAARVKFYEDLAGSPTQVERLRQNREIQANADLDAAFGDKQPVDATPVAETINGVLNNPRGSENTQLQKYVAPLLDRLQNADGTMKSDPEQLYGLREDINRMTSKASQADDPNLSHVAGGTWNDQVGTRRRY
jgi:hypothetical protein